MAIKLRRGTDVERQSIVFEQAEIVYTTDTKKVYIGDGLTAGGNIVSGQPSLTTLDDVNISSVTNSNFLRYNGDTSRWENVAVNTNNISEGSTNLYYTPERFDVRLASKSTDDLTEGLSNLYFTNSRVYQKTKSIISAGTNASVVFDDENETISISSDGRVQSVNSYSGNIVLDSDDIAEGSTNLYHSASRVEQVISNSIDNNSGISFSDSTLSTIYNTTIADDVSSVEAGGASAQPASYWKQKTIVEVLDDILFPTILAYISRNKSLSLGVSGPSGTLEVGTSHSRTLTASFDRGLIKNGDNSDGPPYVGAASQYTFTGTGLTQIAQTSNTASINVDVEEGSNNWAVSVTHTPGEGLYYDNKGNEGSNITRSSGILTDNTSSPSISGVYPYFWGVSSTKPTINEISSAIVAGNANKVVASASGTVGINFNAGNKFLWMVHPASYNTKTKWYINALNNGNIGSESDLFGAVQNTVVDSPDSYWNTQTYKVYISTFATSVSSALEFRNN